jgi:hypothetical protein
MSQILGLRRRMNGYLHTFTAIPLARQSGLLHRIVSSKIENTEND